MKSLIELPRPWRRRPNRTGPMRTVLIAGWLAVALVGCVTGGGKVEYIPADRAVVNMKKGQQAPADGWFVSPDVMQEIIPCLDKRFRGSSTDRPKPSGPAGPTPSLKATP